MKRIEELTRQLGFRVSSVGVERLEHVDDQQVIVTAVQPVLNKADALRLWEELLSQAKDAELAKRDKDHWSHKAFLEKEEIQTLKAQIFGLKAEIERLNAALKQPQAVDAHSVKDSFGTPKDDQS